MSTRPLAHARAKTQPSCWPVRWSALERERIGRLSEALEHERFVDVTCEADCLARRWRPSGAQLGRLLA